MTDFLDTYALLEILRGNPAFRPYVEFPVTSPYNLLEMHVAVARTAGEAKADSDLETMTPYSVDPTIKDLVLASRFKRENARKGFSYADALGYAMARNRGLRFVTGDRTFKGVEGVEFVAGR